MQKILILNLGGQYDQLMARRIRECHVFCEVMPASRVTAQSILDDAPLGIILTGTGDEEVQLDFPLFDLGIPVLAIDQGCRVMIRTLGGELAEVDTPNEHARTLTHLQECILFQELLFCLSKPLP